MHLTFIEAITSDFSDLAYASSIHFTFLLSVYGEASPNHASDYAINLVSQILICLFLFRTPTPWTSFLLVMTKRLVLNYTILTILQPFTSLKRGLLVMAPIFRSRWWTDTTIVECLLRRQLISLISALWRSDPGWLLRHPTSLLKLLTRMVQGSMHGVHQSRTFRLSKCS